MISEGFNIGVTAGDGCKTVPDFKYCLENGVNYVRINLASSWGVNEVQNLCHSIREINSCFESKLSILFDLPYPSMKKRYITYLERAYPVATGDLITLLPNSLGVSDCSQISIDDDFFSTISLGDTIYTGDGEIQYQVVQEGQSCLELQAKNDWFISNSKALVVKDKPLLSQAQFENIYQELIELNAPDAVALSFVESDSELQFLRNQSWLNGIAVFAKIETPTGVKNTASIVSSCDGLIIARGDLMLYGGMANMAAHQNQIIKACNSRRKPVIVATEIFASLNDRPVPLRAELSDYHTLRQSIDNGGVLFTKETSLLGCKERVLPLIKQLES